MPKSHQGSGAAPRLAVVRDEEVADAGMRMPTKESGFKHTSPTTREAIRVLPVRTYFLQRHARVSANSRKVHHALIVPPANKNESAGSNPVERATFQLAASVEAMTWAIIGGLTGWAVAGLAGLGLHVYQITVWAPALASVGAIIGACAARLRRTALLWKDVM